MRARSLLVAFVVLVAACGGDGDDDSSAATSPPPADVTVAAEPAEPTAEPAEPQLEPTAEPTAVPAEPTLAPSPTAPPEPDDIWTLLGIERVELAATEPNQPRPVLSWAPVDGAVRYALVVLDADGVPYWAWTGADPSIRFGGRGEGDDGQVPFLHEAMTWRVSAYDADDRIVAISEPARLEP